jgi:hypothetical protein
MNAEDAFNFVDQRLFIREKTRLSDPERLIFIRSWEGETYEDIRKELNRSSDVARIGAELWHKLGNVLGENVSKKNFKPVIQKKFEEYYRHLEARQENMPTTWRSEQHYENFIGRTDESRSILSAFESNQQKVLSISGLGGMGKTAFCHYVVNEAYEQNLFQGIAWIRARASEYRTNSLGHLECILESKLTVEDALKKLGEELKIANWIHLGEDINKLKKEIKQVLSKNRYLIVIDGLEDANSPEELAEFLPELLEENSKAVLTSREEVIINGRQPYKIRKMKREVSQEFIQKISAEHYPVENPIARISELDFKKILKATDGMPLAMKLFISQMSFLDLDTSLSNLESISKEKQLYDYLFESSFQELVKNQNKPAIILLINLANISSPISISQLNNLGDLSNQQIREGIAKLSKLSLIEKSITDENQNKISLHSFTARYVNEVLRKRYRQF